MNKPNESRDTLMSTVIARLDETLREHFEERAAIMEFDAGLPRAQAECLALISFLDGRPSALGGVVAVLVQMYHLTSSYSMLLMLTSIVHHT